MKNKSLAGLAILFLILLTFSVAPAAETVRIGYLQNDIHQLACWVALEQGLYAKEGLDVRVAGVFKAGPELMSAFSAGELDMGYVGEAPATTAAANGAADVQVLAQVNTEGSAIVVKKDSPITSLSELAGRTQAVPGHSTVQDFLIKKALSQAGVDPDRVNVIVVKPPEMIPALRTDQIDAFIAWEPYPAKAVTMGVGRVLVKSADIWPNHPCCCLAVDRKFLEKHRDRALSLVRAHVKATAYINEHPDEAAQIGVQYTGMDEASVRLAMDNVNYTTEISVAGEGEYVDFLSRLGYIKVKDPAAFVDRFLNPAVLNEVQGP